MSADNDNGETGEEHLTPGERIIAAMVGAADQEMTETAERHLDAIIQASGAEPMAAVIIAKMMDALCLRLHARNAFTGPAEARLTLGMFKAFHDATGLHLDDLDRQAASKKGKPDADS